MKSCCCLFGVAWLVCGRAWALESSTNFGIFDLDLILSNAPIYEVLGLPTANSDDTFADGFAIEIQDSASAIALDGSGKISGVAFVSVTTDTIVDSRLIVNVTGSMGSISVATFGLQGVASTVQMTLAGKGYATDGINYGPARLILRFTGLMTTGTDGTVAQEVDGTFNGAYQPGIKGVKVSTIRNAPATISSTDLGSMSEIDVNGTVSLFAPDLNFTGQILTPLGLVNLPLQGAGTINASNTVQLSLNGVTSIARGSTLAIKSTATDNPFTSDLSVNAITSLTASGKILGQKVKTDSFAIGITPDD